MALLTLKRSDIVRVQEVLEQASGSMPAAALLYDTLCHEFGRHDAGPVASGRFAFVLADPAVETLILAFDKMIWLYDGLPDHNMTEIQALRARLAATIEAA